MTNEDEWGDRLKAARLRAGLTLEDALVGARQALGERVSVSTIRRLEESQPSEDTANVGLVAALCALYGVEVYAISVRLGDRAGHLAQLLIRNSRGPSGRGTTPAYSQSPQAQQAA